jgi:PiT family inorganic phosphate transporter
MGMGLTKLKPIGGFAAETAAALVIEGMTSIGAPVSTTHVISTAIMGVGSAKRLSAVKWILAKDIVWAWILTIPVTSLMGAVITYAFKLFL